MTALPKPSRQHFLSKLPFFFPSAQLPIMNLSIKTLLVLIAGVVRISLNHWFLYLIRLTLLLYQYLSYQIGVAFYNVYLHPLRSTPGPRWWAVSRIPYSLMVISGRAHRKVLELHNKYGDAVRIAPNEVSFTAPQVWKDIMARPNHHENENRKDPVFFSCVASHGSLIHADRQDHSRMRSVVSHGFSAQSMMKQEQFIQHYVDLLIQKLHENNDNGARALDMVRWFNWTTFDIIGDLTFGEPFGCLSSSEYHPWVALIFDTLKLSAFKLAAHRIPLGARILAMFIPKDLVKTRVQHVALTTAKVKKRLSLGTTRPDFTSSMAAEAKGENVRHLWGFALIRFLLRRRER